MDGIFFVSAKDRGEAASEETASCTFCRSSCSRGARRGLRLLIQVEGRGTGGGGRAISNVFFVARHRRRWLLAVVTAALSLALLLHRDLEGSHVLPRNLAPVSLRWVEKRRQ